MSVRLTIRIAVAGCVGVPATRKISSTAATTIVRGGAAPFAPGRQIPADVDVANVECMNSLVS